MGLGAGGATAGTDALAGLAFFDLLVVVLVNVLFLPTLTAGGGGVGVGGGVGFSGSFGTGGCGSGF